MQFIQVNEDAIMMLAERGTVSYCEWSQHRDGTSRMLDAQEATSMNNYARYRPINTQNRATIELRFFDGRTDPVFMKRSLQFVHSLVEFTRNGGAKQPRQWEDYTAYVEQHGGMYPQLSNYLDANKRRITASAVVAEMRYVENVMPRIKQSRVRALEEARAVREYEVERQRVRDSVRENPPTCDCDACTNFGNRAPLTDSQHVAVGDQLRTYVTGGFHVVVTRTDAGTRHAYRSVAEPTWYGNYNMTTEFEGDVQLEVYENNGWSGETRPITLEREAR